mgnify:FL=1
MWQYEPQLSHETTIVPTPTAIVVILINQNCHDINFEQNFDISSAFNDKCFTSHTLNMKVVKYCEKLWDYITIVATLNIQIRTVVKYMKSLKWHKEGLQHFQPYNFLIMQLMCWFVVSEIADKNLISSRQIC